MTDSVNQIKQISKHSDKWLLHKELDKEHCCPLRMASSTYCFPFLHFVHSSYNYIYIYKDLTGNHFYFYT